MAAEHGGSHIIDLGAVGYEMNWLEPKSPQYYETTLTFVITLVINLQGKHVGVKTIDKLILKYLRQRFRRDDVLSVAANSCSTKDNTTPSVTVIRTRTALCRRDVSHTHNQTSELIKTIN